ncbi:alpha-(1-_3)-arabinofuranosyltransferase domain-containing protein [Corynebacterium guangdongense]|uniref:Arabinofuranan 3-O-arabinosyltransferase n=1 Tax=Corynebacterium guangdongense TaxID=1783348 RepID=A0ABU1ZZV5_9CORY|nr:alpha-(1->3)-arabinofuranosyltransferase family protein [Corynebacterium guangdongense]MDR7330431.1 arabinofuranan 3-O-arabinosyltransferase [Corynebacterium guangdongense]WJZ18989.1 Alpha-(1->3)-arabinofuranosyltransferase [Corynebacterium guangdongense]
MRARLTHTAAWLLIALLMVAQEPGRTAADTKLDLLVDPAGFLAGATHAWTDTFTLGQLQNQAYGYLFPQGPFFLATDFLPDWVAQRAWWTVVVGVGFSGMLVLLERLRVGTPAFRILAAGLFAFSPRSLTTLTAISSETWPVMLAPWVLAALLDERLTWRSAARAVVPVALMGAVNATATLAACLPAGVLLLWRVSHDRRALGPALAWLAGCALVSAWWIGPLLVLGAYAPPFTDFIESAYVTTRWLNLAEILRGTTSWAPFVDAERRAGWLLVAEPALVLATMAVAALGLAGLARRERVALHGLWVSMLFLGVAILGAAHGPLGEQWLAFLDGPGAAFRNLHKFDPLVRIPLLVGFAHLGGIAARRFWGAALVALVALAAVSPAWSGRLTPRGTWEEIPDYWVAATDYLNEHAAGTRTLIVPEASFARQDWGWTRDEPAQPLLDVPWAVRDAIPLVPPEAIRGLDGVMTMLDHDPENATQALRRLGIGALLVRGDLDEDAGVTSGRDVRGLEGESFGPLEVVLLDPGADMMITDQAPVTVAGGGEVLALLDTLHGPGPRELVDAGGQIVTDTPMAVARNYGTLRGPVSGPLLDAADAPDVRNREIDYPSVGERTRVVERGGRVRASTSAADATSFGGADPAKSVTAAVDGRGDTAWWPTPGPAEGQWLELAGEIAAQARLSITPTRDTTVLVSNGQAHTEVELRRGRATEVVVPGPATGAVRITLLDPLPVGLAEVSLSSTPIERVVTVPPASAETRMIVLQRLMVDTGVLLREFTTARDMRLEVAADAGVRIDGEPAAGIIDLPAGVHRLESDAHWVTLTEPGFDPSPVVEPTGRVIEASDGERLLMTGRAANAGLRAQVAGVGLTPRVVDAATQAFVVPAGLAGEVEFSFAAERAYRAFLLVGGAVGLLALLAAVVVGRGGRPLRDTDTDPGSGSDPGSGVILPALALTLAAGWVGLAALGAVWAARRVTVFPPALLAGTLTGIAGAWLARAPWTAAGYAGDEIALTAVCAGALACLMPRIRRRAGSSTNS